MGAGSKPASFASSVAILFVVAFLFIASPGGFPCFQPSVPTLIDSAVRFQNHQHLITGGRHLVEWEVRARWGFKNASER
jgi:hypothetical protein